MDFMYASASELIERLGYKKLFVGDHLEGEGDLKYIDNFNQEQLAMAIKNAESDDLISMSINEKGYCIRQPTAKC